MTQFLKAQLGKITPAMRYVAKQENMPVKRLASLVARGQVVIPANRKHRDLRPIGIGKNLTVKINVNLGVSPRCVSLREELKKLALCEKYQADAVMDLSITTDGGKNLDRYRRAIIKRARMPVGTVPIYQVVAQKGITEFTLDDFLEVMEKQAKDGVDFMTIHAGFLKRHLPSVEKRLTGVVSRGGGFLEKWMKKNKKENPLYTGFDEILKIAKKYDVCLSLGDGLRPGSIADAGDRAQFGELKVLGGLTKRCWKAGVQAMIEGPGHVPLQMVEEQVKLQKQYCHGAPLYVLGPVVTDIGAGYDHITGAIGGALIAWKGADFLCYLTPAEHLGLPTVEQVREGIMASKIAAHAADIARGNMNAQKRDRNMSKHRKALDWAGQSRYALDPDKLKAVNWRKKEACSMCGGYCPMGGE